MIELLKGRRLVIAHNPLSSRASEVQRLVFDRLDAAGIRYELVEVQKAPLAENVRHLAPKIKANDVILSAAGDGSAHAVANSVIASGQPGVMMGFLAFGNYNTLPHTFNSGATMTDPVQFLKTATAKSLYPLEVSLDGKFCRYGLLFATMGMTAKITVRADTPAVSHRLGGGKVNLVRSMWLLWWWYIMNKRGSLWPPIKLNGTRHKRTTDVLCLNGRALARSFKTRRAYFDKPVFWCRRLDISRALKVVPFLVSGVLGFMRGDEVGEAKVGFESPANFLVQCDGEVFEAKEVLELVVSKSSAPILVLATR